MHEYSLVRAMTDRVVEEARSRQATAVHRLKVAIGEASGLEVSVEELQASARQAFLRGLALERKQGYADGDYTLPDQVFDHPNEKLKTPNFITREFFSEMKRRVWEVLNPEIDAL